MNLMQLITNENPISIYVVKTFYVILQSYLYYRIISTTLDLKFTNTQKYLFVFTLSTCSIFALFMPTSIMIDILNIVLFVLILYFILKLNIKKVLFAIFISYFCAILSESIIGFILVYLLKLDLNEIQTVPIYNFIAQLLGSISLYFTPQIICILRVFILKIRIRISSKVSIIVILILGLTTMILETYLLSTNIDKIPIPLTMTIIISTLLYFITTMYSLIRTNILDKTKEDLENAQLYNQTLSLLHDNIRGFKHDFNNIVQAIGGYLAVDDVDGLKKYYEKLLEDCRLTNNLNLLNPETINNPSIYSLLTNKYFVAVEKGITMTFSIFSNLSGISTNMYEVSRILGILLDNAIEAAEETENKLIYVEIKSDEKRHIFIIKNNCKNLDISVERIFEKGYSTKNRNSGFGLWYVHKTLSKNTNLDLYTSIEEEMFSQKFTIYHK